MTLGLNLNPGKDCKGLTQCNPINFLEVTGQLSMDLPTRKTSSKRHLYASLLIQLGLTRSLVKQSVGLATAPSLAGLVLFYETLLTHVFYFLVSPWSRQQSATPVNLSVFSAHIEQPMTIRLPKVVGQLFVNQ